MLRSLSKFLAFSLLAISISSVTAEGVDPMKLPKLTQYVEDFSNTISLTELTELRQIASNYEIKTTTQMTVVIIPNRAGNEIFDIGMQIFKDNAIGQKGKDNGILLVIASEEKKLRIITGYGLEGDIPDVLASDFIEKSIRPLVGEGKLKEAVQAFFTRTMAAIGTDEGKKLQAQADTEGIWITAIMALVFGLIFSFNLFFLVFALVFFVIASFSIGSVLPVVLFVIGSMITTFVGFHFFNPDFAKAFFQMPKNNGGGSGGSWGGGSGGGGGGGFSGGGGSSGGGGAGD